MGRYIELAAHATVYIAAATAITLAMMLLLPMTQTQVQGIKLGTLFFILVPLGPALTAKYITHRYKKIKRGFPSLYTFSFSIYTSIAVLLIAVNEAYHVLHPMALLAVITIVASVNYERVIKIYLYDEQGRGVDG